MLCLILLAVKFPLYHVPLQFHKNSLRTSLVRHIGLGSLCVRGLLRHLQRPTLSSKACIEKLPTLDIFVTLLQPILIQIINSLLAGGNNHALRNPTEFLKIGLESSRAAASVGCHKKMHTVSKDQAKQC